MCAPREVVLQQMWREEEDGTFIVLLHSTKHRRAAMPPASWSWWQPIRAQVCPLACPLTWLSSSLLFCLLTLPWSTPYSMYLHRFLPGCVSWCWYLPTCFTAHGASTVSLCLTGSTFLHAPAQGPTHAACHMTQQQGVSGLSTDCTAMHRIIGCSALNLEEWVVR